MLNIEIIRLEERIEERIMKRDECYNVVCIHYLMSVYRNN